MPSDPRTHLMSSLTNFRDLGGFSLGGRRLKQGLFYRSPRLTDLSPADLAWLEQQDVDTIVDFRGIAERNAAPLTLSTGLMARRLSLTIEPTMGERLRKLEAQNQRDDAAVAKAMKTSYRAYVQNNLDAFAAFLQVCAHAEGAGRDLLLGVGPRYLEAAFDELDRMGETAQSFAQASMGDAKTLEIFR